MKRGNKLLTYLFVSLISIFGMTFLSSQIASAANDIVCYDRGNNMPCTASTEDAYFVIERYEVLETETNLILPDTAEYSGTTYNIEEIASNAIVVVDSYGSEVSTKLALDTLTLPQNLLMLNDYSLNEISTLKTLNLPIKLMTVGSKIFDDSSII